MKKILMVVVNLITMLVIKNTANAQLQNVAANSDSTIIVNSVYAGMLATTGYDTQEKKQSTNTSFRIGASLSWKINPKLYLRSWAIMDVATYPSSTNVYTLQAFWLQYKPTEKWQLEVGQLGTLAAQQHRPLPASNSGQFETWTQSKFPGLAPTINIKYLPGNGTMFAVGLSNRASQPEYQISMTKGQWQASGFYQDATKSFGAGFTYISSNGMYKNTGLWKQGNVLANITNIFLDRKKTVLFYNDLGYSLHTSHVIRWEPGILKVFSMKYVKGLIGIGYQHEVKNINAYLYITL
jgi:hypothetical protein